MSMGASPKLAHVHDQFGIIRGGVKTPILTVQGTWFFPPSLDSLSIRLMCTPWTCHCPCHPPT